ncbi:MAG: hypothetical protein GX235_12075 [Clostridiales bacterium]|nr:hypothetical protein [Clostridiales bacterium]
MNKKIGIRAASINLIAVIGFSVSMLVNAKPPTASYLTSMGNAFSFVVMICTFAHYAEETSRVAAFAAMLFGGMYAICNSIVYFIQLATVRNDSLTGQAASLLHFQQYGLMFNLDMLGYSLMSLSTFFIGLTIQEKKHPEKWLKWLLIIHGAFAVCCFIVPLLGIFNTETAGNSSLAGILILEFWCIYFAPISVLSISYFSNRR